MAGKAPTNLVAGQLAPYQAGPAPATRSTQKNGAGRTTGPAPSNAPTSGTGTGPAAQRTARPVRLPATVSAGVETGAGFVLGLLAWGWVGLPLLRGGPAEVRKVLKAKFFNKAPDGSWLS